MHEKFPGEFSIPELPVDGDISSGQVGEVRIKSEDGSYELIRATRYKDGRLVVTIQQMKPAGSDSGSAVDYVASGTVRYCFYGDGRDTDVVLIPSINDSGPSGKGSLRIEKVPKGKVEAYVAELISRCLHAGRAFLPGFDKSPLE